MIEPPTAVLTSQWLAFLTPLSIATLTLVQLWTARRTAQKAKEVKEVLAVTTSNQDQKMGEIHTLVNSERGILLEMYASAMEVIAKQSGDMQAIEAAKIARGMVEDHHRKQAAVDAKNKEVQI